MRHAFIILLTAAAPAAFGQAASQAETEAISAIGECLLEGLPSDWRLAQMIVELPEPLAATGSAQYLVARGEIKDRLEPFTPCDVRKPARTLIEIRERQPPERRGWTAARLVLHPDGRFELNYDYPK
jgi:hypothetical protein